MPRLIIVSNRLPVRARLDDGELVFDPSVGGVATGLRSFYRDYDSLWVGWLEPPEPLDDPAEREAVTARLLKDHSCIPVFISPEDVALYYDGFSNGTLWPTFHHFTQYARFEDAWWDGYVRVNQLFLETVLEVAGPDDVIWVHDYHLMLLPQMLRERLPGAAIGFFLHIPFPSFEIFRTLPWRKELLEGVLGADLAGFHTYDYVRHFLSSVLRLTGHEHLLGEISVGHHHVKADTFPMGIDYARYRGAADTPAVQAEIARLRADAGGCRIILSIDRLDYTKGILQRLEAYDDFLEAHPEHQADVVLVLVAVPSRTDVAFYQQEKRDLDELVGRISGKYGFMGWTPIRYTSAQVPFESLAALYALAEVALVTPLRDGMNLIGKEYVATHEDDGVLVLSEMAGVAKELGEAIIVNPFNRSEMAGAIAAALDMPENERRERMAAMKERLSRYDVVRWAEDFLDSLQAMRDKERTIRLRLMTGRIEQTMDEEYRAASRRLILLDYDGTLVGFTARPHDARPDAALLSLLDQLTADPANEVVIISGRDRITMEQWFGRLDLSVISDHGVWIRERGGTWESPAALSGEWKDSVRPVLQRYVDRTPGALLEDKEFSIAWHFRAADPFIGPLRARELRDALQQLTGNMDLSVLEGNKVLEVKSAGVNKGRAASLWLERGGWDFILAIGDDRTDEDVFAALPERACSIRVGWAPSKAAYYADSVAEVRRILTRLAG